MYKNSFSPNSPIKKSFFSPGSRGKGKNKGGNFNFYVRLLRLKR